LSQVRLVLLSVYFTTQDSCQEDNDQKESGAYSMLWTYSTIKSLTVFIGSPIWRSERSRSICQQEIEEQFEREPASCIPVDGKLKGTRISGNVDSESANLDPKGKNSSEATYSHLLAYLSPHFPQKVSILLLVRLARYPLYTTGDLR